MKPKILTRLPEILAGLLFGRRWHEGSSRIAAGNDQYAALPTIGVFIDFDNINGAAIPLVFQHLSSRWNPTWRRAYGTGLAKHRSLLHANGMLPIEIFPNSPRKNSTDIALVIDVVLAACSDSVDAFCIVSSDGDYTRLALTLREKGKRLLIVGRSSTPPSLRSACAEFIDLHELSRASPGISTRIAASEAEGWGYQGNSSKPQSPVVAGDRPWRGMLPNAQVDPADLIPLIRELTGESGKTTLKAIQIRCSRRYADFSPRMCGATKWRPLLQMMAVFTVDPIKDKSGKIQDYAVAFRAAALASEVVTDQ